MAMSRAAGAREAAGHRVMHLEVGQPATGLPETARRAVIGALNSPLGYTNATGLSELRERLADRHNGLGASAARPLDRSRIVVVAGASAGFSLAFLTLFEPGQRVGVIEPGYPCYRNALIALGIEAVPIPVGPESRWAPTARHLSEAGHLDGLVLASPSNPTGTVLSADALAEVARYCANHNIAIVADEIYHGIIDDGIAPPMLDHAPDAIVINSFSKYFSKSRSM